MCGDEEEMERQRGWCALWSAEGKKKPKGKGWNRGEGSVGAVVGCLYGVQWLERWGPRLGFGREKN